MLAVFVRIKIPPRAAWPRVVLAGLLGQTLYQGLLMTGEFTVAAGTASILIATAPLFSVVAAALLLGESMRSRWTGVVVAFGGTVLVGASLGLGASSAGLFVLAAALCQGLDHVVVKPLTETIGALSATGWSVWVGAAMATVGLPALRVDAGGAPHVVAMGSGIPRGGAQCAWAGRATLAAGRRRRRTRRRRRHPGATPAGRQRRPGHHLNQHS